MKIIVLLIGLLLTGYLVMTQLRTATDPNDENAVPYQQQMNKAEDVGKLLQQGVDERGAQYDQMLEDSVNSK